jgi:hypothetical protein
MENIELQNIELNKIYKWTDPDKDYFDNRGTYIMFYNIDTNYMHWIKIVSSSGGYIYVEYLYSDININFRGLLKKVTLPKDIKQKAIRKLFIQSSDMLGARKKWEENKFN